MNDRCLAVERLIEEDPAAREHVAGCYPCREESRDLRRLQILARGAGPGWAGRAAPAVDVEAALERVVEAAPPSFSRAACATQVASLAAAAVLIASLLAPTLLRARVEAGQDGPRAPLVAASAGPTAALGLVFWTSSTR